MKNTYLSLLLALVLSIWASKAYSYDAQIDGINYNFSGTDAIVTFGGDYSGNISIPEYVTYNGTTYHVTSIDSEAFHAYSSLVSVTLPESITSIGKNAFQFCSNLTTINIPNNLTLIDDEVFSHCKSLTSITIPKSVVSIGEYAFSGCI